MSATRTREDCPEPMLLSQLADGELDEIDAATERRLRVHVAACDQCRNDVAALERAAHVGRAGVARLATGTDPFYAVGRIRGDDCLAESELASLAEAVAPSARVEQHLAHCDACLHEAREMFRMNAQLARAPLAPVPTALAERVASRWRETAEPSLSEVVIRVAREGLELVRRTLVAPLVDLEALPAAAASLRSSTESNPLRFKLQASAGSIEATVVPDGDSVHLDLLLRDLNDVALGGERIFLRQKGRSLFSARTNEAGEIHLPRIDPGVYEVACTGIDTSFRLDLRRDPKR